MPAKNVTVTATYKNIQYTISFDANGGSGSIANVSKEYNESFLLPANTLTAPEGKQFKCWSVDGVEKSVGEIIIISKDTTIKAVWEDVKPTTPETPTDPTTPITPKEEVSAGLSGGAIAGIVIGSAALVAISVYFALGFTLYKKGKLTGKFFKTIFKWIKR